MKASIVLALLCLASWIGPAFPQPDDRQAYEIARRAQELSRGNGTYAASGTMRLDSSRGAAVRKFHFSSMATPAEVRSILVFDWPGDIRGTALLTYSRVRGGDSQWVYLSAARRVKRISSGARSGSFLGSEFAYEDMVEQALDNFTYAMAGQESCCNIVERVPKGRSGYSRQLVHFNKRSGLIDRVEYFDRRGAKHKTLTISGYSRLGDVWKPNRLRMVNHLTGKSTTLSWRNFRTGLPLDASDFSPNALRRAR